MGYWLLAIGRWNQLPNTNDLEFKGGADGETVIEVGVRRDGGNVALVAVVPVNSPVGLDAVFEAKGCGNEVVRGGGGGAVDILVGGRVLQTIVLGIRKREGRAEGESAELFGGAHAVWVVGCIFQ